MNAEPDDIGDPPCPRDGGTLRPSAAARIRACDRCGGSFLRDPRAYAAFSEAGVNASALGRIGSVPPACPACRGPMDARLVSGVEIDLCRACAALWLDAGERDKLDTFLKDPERAAGPRPVSGPEERESDFYSDYGMFGALLNFLFRWP